MAHFAAEAAAETLWPTRCAICDTPGAVLCERCRASLPYVDWWRACRTCGSPLGLVQCDFCNPVILNRFGMESLPFDACASAVCFDGDTGQIVRVFKDQGEQRLAEELAHLMSRVIPPSWDYDAITFVPATLSALRYRGYDHAELLARAIARQLGVPCLSLLSRPKTRDQRKLGGAERIANLQNSFTVRENATGQDEPLRNRKMAQSKLAIPQNGRKDTSQNQGRAQIARQSLILVDDVFTTGATLCAASQALSRAGAERIYCLTFARV